MVPLIHLQGHLDAYLPAALVLILEDGLFLQQGRERHQEHVEEKNDGQRALQSVPSRVDQGLGLEREGERIDKVAHQVDEAYQEIPGHLVKVVRLYYVLSDPLMEPRRLLLRFLLLTVVICVEAKTWRTVANL